MSFNTRMGDLVRDKISHPLLKKLLKYPGKLIRSIYDFIDRHTE